MPAFGESLGNPASNRVPPQMDSGEEPAPPSKPSPAVLYPAAALSLLAALVHLAVTPEHFEEWWGYGSFFLAAALVQALYAPLLLWRPSRPLLLAGVLGNSAIVLLYLVTRTLGVPLLGPGAGEVEGVGALDACATASEVVLVGVLGVLLLWRLLRERVALVLIVAAAASLFLAHLPHLVLLFRLL